MELKKLFTEDRAVSPVIAVVLMIAVTVILAAVVAAFALGLGGGGASAPQASFDFEFHNGSAATITHETGDELTDSNMEIRVGTTTAYEGAGNTGAGSADLNWNNNGSTDQWGSTVSAGSYIEMDDSSVGGLSGTSHAGEEVRIIWSSSEGGDSATIAKTTWPQ